MKPWKGMAVLVGAAAVLFAGVACGDQPAAAPDPTNTPNNQQTSSGDPTSVPQSPSPNVAPSAPDTGENRDSTGGSEPSTSVAPGAPISNGSSGSQGGVVSPGMPAPEPAIDPASSRGVGQAPAPMGMTQPGYAVDYGISYGGASAFSYQQGAAQTGIWVSGRAERSVAPDVAYLDFGVQTTAESVVDAREAAAAAMDAIISAIRNEGVSGENIQTRSFNIYPQYEWVEDRSDTERGGRQELAGYTVSNSVAVKITELPKVGPIIDAVVEAGGDATRINGVSYSVEDTDALMDELREEAVNKAAASAEEFASLAGVGLGSITFITESGGDVPVMRDGDMFARAESAGGMPAPQAPVSPGQLTVSLTVQAGFAIE